MDLIEAFNFTLTTVPYVLAIVFAIVLFLVLAAMYWNPLVAAGVVLLVTVWETAVPAMPVLHLGISISPFDLAFACIGGVALIRFVSVPRGSYVLSWPLVVVVVVLFVSFAVGLSRFGARAGVEFRNDFYFWSLCAYLMTFRASESWINRLLDMWLIGAFVMCLLIWYRWLADAFGIDWIEPFWRYADATNVSFTRVAASSVALVLGLAVLVSVDAIATGRVSPVHYLFLPALLLTIVFLQHRSVWVATLLPLLLLVMRRARWSQRSRGPMLAALASMLVVGAVLGSGVFGGATESVSQQAVRATSTTEGTFVGRVQGWQELVRRWSGLGPVGMAIGEPYGSGFERHVGRTWGGVKVEYAPHNYFVTLLLRGGLFGLLAFLVILWRLSVAGLAPMERDQERFGPPLVLAVALCVGLYCIPYSPTPASAVLFGTAMCIAWRANNRSPAANVEPGSPAGAMMRPVRPPSHDVLPLSGSERGSV